MTLGALLFGSFGGVSVNNSIDIIQKLIDSWITGDITKVRNTGKLNDIEHRLNDNAEIG